MKRLEVALLWSGGNLEGMTRGDCSTRPWNLAFVRLTEVATSSDWQQQPRHLIGLPVEQVVEPYNGWDRCLDKSRRAN